MKNPVFFLFVVPWLVVQLGTTIGCQNDTGIKSDASSSSIQDNLISRAFEFKYGATVSGIPKDATVRVWFPVAETNEQQQVNLIESSTPGEIQLNRDSRYGNRIGFFETTTSVPGDLDFGLTFDVNRVEARVDNSTVQLSDAQKKLFLSANSLVPIDGKPRLLLEEKELPEDSMAAGEVIYNVVEQHMSYDKSQPGYGHGDAVWACDSKTGNCTDFHSLFVSLARSSNIPARFEIGFSLPSDETEGTIGGYHCWAWFHVEGTGWTPVDISEADKHPELKDYYFGNLTADRIALSTGRDIELVPKSSGPPLNYFVYPYVEVDGLPWPQEKFKLNFSFKDKH